MALTAPTDHAVFRSFVLSSGRTVRPIFSEHGIEAIVSDEADAHELQREGWKRHSPHATSIETRKTLMPPHPHEVPNVEGRAQACQRVGPDLTRPTRR